MCARNVAKEGRDNMLPSREEVKEAIKWGECFSNNFKDGVSKVKELEYADKMLSIFDNLAQAYIDTPVVEEKKIDWAAGRTIHLTSVDYQAGFNEALRLDRIEWMKWTSVEELKAVITEILVNNPTRDYAKEAHQRVKFPLDFQKQQAENLDYINQWAINIHNLLNGRRE